MCVCLRTALYPLSLFVPLPFPFLFAITSQHAFCSLSLRFLLLLAFSFFFFSFTSFFSLSLSFMLDLISFSSSVLCLLPRRVIIIFGSSLTWTQSPFVSLFRIDPSSQVASSSVPPWIPILSTLPAYFTVSPHHKGILRHV